MNQPDLGKKIAELRKAKSLTQEELVEKCNLNVRTLQRIESGEVTPRSYTTKAIFTALDYNVYDSIEMTSSKFKQTGFTISNRLEQFYRYVLDLFNLKTNTMRKITVLSIILASIVFGVFIINPELLAQYTSKKEYSKNETIDSLRNQGNVCFIMPKVRYLFKWALNPVEVNLPSGSNFMTDNGVIKRIGEEVYIIPYKIGELKVSSKDFSQKFEVLPLPDAQFKIGGDILSRGSKTNVSKLMTNRSISVYYGLGLRTDFDVFEYSIFFNQGKADEEKFVISGNQITNKEIDVIRRGIKEQKEVVIDYIALRMPDGFVVWNGVYKIEE